MEILNSICYGCASLLCAGTSLIIFIVFCTSVYACFTKKIEGKLLAKLLIVLVSGCICPWFIRASVFFLTKIGA